MATLDKYRSLDRQPEYMTRLEGSVTYKFYESCEEIAFTPKPRPCHMIVTCKSMLWTLMTIGATLVVSASIITPQWLVGRPKWIGLRSEKHNGSIYDHKDKTYTPTIGIFNRCTKIHRFGGDVMDHCATYVTTFNMDNRDFPDYWKSALIFFTISVVLMVFTSVASVLSVCVQSAFEKSIFTLTGLVQSVAGLFLVVGLVLYPAGWGEQRIKGLCGEHAQAFLLDHCSLGWAFYACAGGTIMVFVCAVLSIKAEEATTSDKVESEVLEGRRMICVL